MADARQAISERAGLDRVRPLIADLEQIAHALPASASAAAGAASSTGNGAPAGGNGDQATADDDEEVVDAEFTRE